MLLSESSSSKSYPEVTDPEATVPIKTTEDVLYGFDYITDESVQILYGLVDEYANKRSSTTFKIEGELSERQMYEAIEAYRNDHPEVFWLDSGTYYYYENNYTYIDLIFTMDSTNREQAKSDFNDKVDEIVANAPSDASDFDLELYVHDYIIDNCTYDSEAAESDEKTDTSNNAYGAVVGGKTVCEGYAMAFNLLCNRLGVDCINISGASDGDSHMWNAVLIDGEWYQVDVTWDDPDSDEDEVSRYLYFNLTDDEMYDSHTASVMYDDITDDEFVDYELYPNIYLPKCTATEYNYYEYYGVTIYDIEQSDEVIEKIAQAAQNKDEYFYFLLDGSLGYDSVSDSIINDGYLGNWIDSANLKNFYFPTLDTDTNVYKIKDYRLIIIELNYSWG
jgi:hypothetical protein